MLKNLPRNISVNRAQLLDYPLLLLPPSISPSPPPPSSIPFTVIVSDADPNSFLKDAGNMNFAWLDTGGRFKGTVFMRYVVTEAEVSLSDAPFSQVFDSVHSLLPFLQKMKRY